MIAVFWYVVSCNLLQYVDISEKPAASIFMHIPDDGLHDQTAQCHSVTAVRTLKVIGTFISNFIFVTNVLM